MNNYFCLVTDSHSMRLEWNGVLDMRMKSRKSADPILVRMLGKVSLVTLQKAVVYGAALSVTGSSILYYMTQSNINTLSLLVAS